MSRRLLGLLSFAGFALLLWRVAAEGDRTAAPLDRSAEEWSAPADVGAAQAAPSVQADPLRTSVPEAGPRDPARAARGVVLCAATGIPLAAVIETPKCIVRSDAATGAFTTGVPVEPKAVRLAVRCDGFEERPVLLPVGSADVDLGVIPLTPNCTGRFHVVDESDAPVEGAEIVLARTVDYVRELRPQEHVLGVTDSRGDLVAALATVETVYAREGSRQSEPALFDPRAVSATMTLKVRGGIEIGLRRAEDGGPITGVQIKARGIDVWPVVERVLVTGESGLAVVRLNPGWWELALDWDSPVCFDAEAIQRSIALGSLNRRKLLLRLQRDASIVWLDATPSEAGHTISVRLVDAERATPLERVVLWKATRAAIRPGEESVWRSVLPVRTVALTDGLLQIDDGVCGPVDQIERLVLAPPGYLSRSIDAPRRSLPEGRTVEVAFEGAPRRTIRLVDGRGEPVEGRFRIVEGRSELCAGSTIWSAEGVESALAGPCSWGGGDWLIESDLGSTVTTVPARRLAEEEEVTVAVDCNGEIRVAVPTGVQPDLVCRAARSMGPEIRSGVQVGDRVRFDDLRPGEYVVGTRGFLSEWSPMMLARNATSRGVALARVEPCGVADVGWRDEWSGPFDVECVVQAEGISLEELFVVPWYSPEGSNPPIGSYFQRFPVSADGRCRLRGLDARPAALLVARSGPQGFSIPLAMTRPGGIAEVRCGSALVEVRDSSEPVKVFYRPQVEQLEAGIFVLETGPLGRVLVEGIPVSTRELVVNGLSIPVTLVAGRCVDVRVP